MPSLQSLSTFLSVFFISLAIGSSPALADPPSWAPAHGYHKDKGKQKKNKHHKTQYEVEYREPSASQYEPLSCDPHGFTNSDIGTVIGGVIGGILGSNIGKGSGKTLATIAGVIVGASIGNTIGASMDEADRYCAGQAFVHAEDSQAVVWTNPDTQQQYTVTPQRSYTQNNGQKCRDYTSRVILNGQQDEVTGTACKDNNGNWQIVS